MTTLENALASCAKSGTHVRTARGLKFSVLSQDSLPAQFFPVASDAKNGRITSYEVGALSAEVDEFMEFVEDEAEPLTTIYRYVPVDVIIDVIEKNGGLA